MDHVLELPVREVLVTPKKQIETIITPGHGKILFVNDIFNLSPVPIVVHKESVEDHEALNGIYKDGWEEKIIMPENEKITRFMYCVNTLALPDEYAAILAFGSTEDLRRYPVPPQGTKQPLLVAMRGESSPEKSGGGVGKSTITACLAELLGKKHNVIIFDFEPLYQENASLYAKELKDKGWKGGYKEAVEIINKLWGGKKSKQPAGNVKPIRHILDGNETGQGLEYFRNTSERPDLIICDMPGVPGVTRGKLGEITSQRRDENIYDLFGLGAKLKFHNTRRVLIESAHTGYKQMDAKLKDMVRIIEEKM
jgi:hypothetical protein